jgi:Cys-tRNA(Pro)/Cys-tRNA(Cys) deacylase
VAGRGTPATALLGKQRIAHTVHTYEHDPRRAGYGQEASDALGVAPERVFKTLVAQVDGALTVGVVPVGSRLDLKALAAAAGGRKAAMADPGDAERATGYVVGQDLARWGSKRLPVVLKLVGARVRHHLLQRRPPRAGDRDRAGRPGPGGARHRGGYRPATGLSPWRPPLTPGLRRLELR